MMKYPMENKILRSVLDVTKEEAERLLVHHKENKGLCEECGYYRPLKEVDGHKLCKLCE